MKRFLGKYYFEILLGAPMFLYIALLTYYPILQVVLMSFDSNGETEGFVWGLSQYREIFNHSQFLSSFLNTIFITIVGLGLELTVGLFIAVQLNKKLKASGIFRGIILLPMGIPTIVAATSMRNLFDSNGAINSFLQLLGVIDIPIDWASGGLITLFSIIVSDMWKVTPMVMLILLSGLQSIPGNLLEAAQMDGATAWQSFRKIILPMLKPFITMAIVIRGIDCFRIFELPLVLAGKSTPVLSTFSYFEFSEALNPHTSAASSVILLLLIFISISVYLFWGGDHE